MIPGGRKSIFWLHVERIFKVSQNAIQAYVSHRTGRMAAALAYYALFSLFPLLLLVLSIIGYLLDAGWSVAVGAKEFLVQLTTELIPTFGDLVNNALVSIKTGRGASGIIGLLGLVWAASSTFNQLHISLDQIWGLEGTPDLRLTVKRRSVSILMVVSMALFLILVQAIKSFIYWLTFITDQFPGGLLLHAIMTWLFPFFAAVITFGLMYQLFPSVRISWRDVWPGAVLAGVGWEALKLIFAIYVARFTNWQDVYGPVASVIGLLTWLYLSFTVILFGAEFSAAYSVNGYTIPDNQVEKQEITQVSALLVVESTPTDEPPPAGKKMRKKKGTGLVAGLEAGIIGLVATMVIAIGFLLKRKSNRIT